MPSAPIDYALLHAVHAKLRVLADLQDQLERCPRMVRAADAAEKKLQAEWEAARALLMETRKQADEKQLQLAQREARIEKMSGQKNAAESAREYQLLGDQITADQQANAVLSDEILELLERVDRLIVDLAQAKSNHDKGLAEAARVKLDVVEREKRIQADLARARAELIELEKRLPGEQITEYRRLVKASGENALSETDGESCGGCHSVITTQTRSDLFSKKPVFCKNCGTLLYMAPGAAVSR
jgi:uncharacterized protein